MLCSCVLPNAHINGLTHIDYDSIVEEIREECKKMGDVEDVVGVKSKVRKLLLETARVQVLYGSRLCLEMYM